MGNYLPVWLTLLITPEAWGGINYPRFVVLVDAILYVEQSESQGTGGFVGDCDMHLMRDGLNASDNLRIHGINMVDLVLLVFVLCFLRN